MLNIELFEQLARTIIANGYHHEQSNTYIMEEKHLKKLTLEISYAPNSGPKQIIYIQISSKNKVIHYHLVGDETVFLYLFTYNSLDNRTISQQAIRKLMRRIYKVIC